MVFDKLKKIEHEVEKEVFGKKDDSDNDEEFTVKEGFKRDRDNIEHSFLAKRDLATKGERNLIHRAKKTEWSFHLEAIRFWGLAAGGVLLTLGKFVTNKYTDAGLINAGYIFSTYHFRHTCVYLDYNPSRTLSALIVMVQTLPLCFFIVAFYFKVKQLLIKGEIAKDSTLVWITGYGTPIMFITQVYFFMVFVNHPDDNTFHVPSAADPTNTDKSTWVIQDYYNYPLGFIFHYLPYMLWQAGMIIMAIQHNYYLIETDKLRDIGISKKKLTLYNTFIILAGATYTLFVWSFILGTPLWDTTENPGKAVGIFAMYGFDAVVVLLPAVFAAIEAYVTFPHEKFTIEFSVAEIGTD